MNHLVFLTSFRVQIESQSLFQAKTLVNFLLNCAPVVTLRVLPLVRLAAAALQLLLVAPQRAQAVLPRRGHRRKRFRCCVDRGCVDVFAASRFKCVDVDAVDEDGDVGDLDGGCWLRRWQGCWRGRGALVLY